jgi:fumarylacetoacetase
MVPDSTRIPKNWFYAPSVYNSRASSVVPSGTSLHRPKGVFYQPGTDQVPKYGPSEALDFELEMGYFVSKPVPFGEVMEISDAKEHIFGFVLLNDWSARDLQMFEMKPLGPFHSKGSKAAPATCILSDISYRLRHFYLELDHHS